MRRPARTILVPLLLLSGLPHAFAGADEPTSEEAHTPLASIARREEYVFASTVDGLFRAPVATRRWERLEVPPEMPRGGTFVPHPGRLPVVLYVIRHTPYDPPARPGARFGLYRSKDDGATWTLVAERSDFGSTLLHPNGVLYAITGCDGNSFGRHVLRSTDLGSTWTDITGAAQGEFLAIQSDPRHPGLVRLAGGGMHLYYYEATDDTYQWKAVPADRFPLNPEAGNDFFRRDPVYGNRIQAFRATLANYFEHDFGEQTYLHALELRPAKDRFEFPRGAPVTVPIRVVYRYDPETLVLARSPVRGGKDSRYRNPSPLEKFADRPGETEFWGLRVESAGKRFEKLPYSQGTKIWFERQPDGRNIQKRSDPPALEYQSFLLSPSSPYEGTLDLGRLADFSRPGEYRVQVLYGAGGVRFDDIAVWHGRFTSPVFTVVIRE